MPRPQFTLRALLVATTAAATCLGIVVRQAHRQRDEVRFIESIGGRAGYDFQFGSSGWFDPNAKPIAPSWIVAILGVDFFGDVICVQLPRKVSSDKMLDRVLRLPRLRSLNTGGRGVTDAGLSRLAHHARLEELWLASANVGDEGVVHLAGNQTLKLLVLSHTRVSDASVDVLGSIAALETLYVQGTRMTRHGIKRLRIILPNCDIQDKARF
jgi:hypothetical protein